MFKAYFRMIPCLFEQARLKIIKDHFILREANPNIGNEAEINLWGRNEIIISTIFLWSFKDLKYELYLILWKIEPQVLYRKIVWNWLSSNDKTLLNMLNSRHHIYFCIDLPTLKATEKCRKGSTAMPTAIKKMLALIFWWSITVQNIFLSASLVHYE